MATANRCSVGCCLTVCCRTVFLTMSVTMTTWDVLEPHCVEHRKNEACGAVRGASIQEKSWALCIVSRRSRVKLSPATYLGQHVTGAFLTAVLVQAGVYCGGHWVPAYVPVGSPAVGRQMAVWEGPPNTVLASRPGPS